MQHRFFQRRIDALVTNNEDGQTRIGLHQLAEELRHAGAKPQNRVIGG